MGGRIAFFGLIVGACGGPPAAVQEPPAPVQEPAVKAEPAQAKVDAKAETQPGTKEAPVVDGFEAVVRVDARPGGKKFQGVWLERKDGERWVVAYRPEGWLKPFEGRTVKVTGATYQPFGQAINATHYKIATLEVAAKERGMGPWFGVGPELTLQGKFARATGSPGTKSEGSSWWTFVTADGKGYEVEGSAEEAIEADVAVQVVARQIEPDMSYVARRGGEALWIVKIDRP